MKRLLCLLLVCVIVYPVFAARPYTEAEVDAVLEDCLKAEEKAKRLEGANDVLQKAYLGAMKENSKLLDEKMALESDKELEKAIEPVRRVLQGGLGVWGLVNFAGTGTVYPLVTGGLFLYNAVR